MATTSPNQQADSTPQAGPTPAPTPTVGPPEPSPTPNPAPAPTPVPAANDTVPLEAKTVQPTAPLPELRKGENIDTLLTPTEPKPPAKPDPDYVHLGSLKIEKSLFNDFKAAETYLAKDPEAVKMLSQLVHDPQPHTIHKIGPHDPEGDRFSPAGKMVGDTPFQHGGEIYWNPHGALRNTDGTAVSPALALLHEQGHSWEWTSDPKGYLKGVESKTERFTTAEEQRNERGIEAHAARVLGEPVRQNHLGQPFEVAGPASREPLPTPTRHFSNDELKATIDAYGKFYRDHGYDAPPPAANAKDAIVPWDHKAHEGSFLRIDEHTAVQHVGRGQYQVYDIDKDLGGKQPPMFERLSVNEHGAFRTDTAQTREQAGAAR